MPTTVARVDMEIYNNATWTDAFQFGVVGDTSWNLAGQNFRLDIKGNKDSTTILLTLSTATSTIVVDDTTQRILHFNVPETAIVAALLPGEYVYDLVMYDYSTPAVRIVLMGGKLTVRQGVTGG